MPAGVAPRPGATAARLPPDTLCSSLLFFAFLPLWGGGGKHMDFARHGLESGAWFVGLVLSAAFGALAAARVIIPYRHVEFMIVTLALPVGSGFVHLVELGGLSRRTLTVAGIAGVLVAASAATAFPPAD